MKVIIEKLDHFGRGITRIDNKICFVENALPNEEVEIEITKENKKYIEAKAIKIIKESNNRKEILCPYYEVCGGCDLLHLSFIEENKYKHNKIVELLKSMEK